MSFEFEEKSVYEVINYVYKRVISARPKDNIQDIIYLIVFFLCFSNVDNAVTLVLGVISIK